MWWGWPPKHQFVTFDGHSRQMKSICILIEYDLNHYFDGHSRHNLSISFNIKYDGHSRHKISTHNIVNRGAGALSSPSKIINLSSINIFNSLAFLPEQRQNKFNIIGYVTFFIHKLIGKNEGN